MSDFKLTDEQEIIASTFDDNVDITVEALAGTGKTSTLRVLGERHFDRNGLFLAYNASVAKQAKETFPRNVECKTGHGLAWKPVIKWQNSDYGKRLANSERMPARTIAANLHIDKAFKVKDDVFLEPSHMARMVMDTLRYFCNSNKARLDENFVPYQEGIEGKAWSDLKELVYEKAVEAWKDITNPRGWGKFEHDHYLKLWALSNPTLDYDFILYDEAQDANPVIADVIMHQDCQKVFVGDTNQAIYGWRGAIDAMANFGGKRLYLSQSFRFGDAVAVEANKFLSLLDSPIKVKGFSGIESTTEMLLDPDVILCRTNGCGIQNVMLQQGMDKKVAFVGGGNEIKSFMYHAMALMKGERPKFPYAPLAAFADWAEVLDYIENDAGGSDLKVMARLAKDYGPYAVIQAVDALVPEKEAEVTISTAHKAKGREWDKVLIAEDFNSLFKPDEETGKIVVPSKAELMLAYVAVTRAKKVLDIGGLAGINSVEGIN